MSMRHYFGDDDQPPTQAGDPAEPIDEIAIALRVVARLVGTLPPGAHTSRLAVAIEGAQAAAAAHAGRKVKR